MKTVSLILALAASALAVAQENTLPTTGNVGVGTLTPSAKLDVKGTMRVDSTLTVKDELVTESDARIGEDLKVEGQLYVPNMQMTENMESGMVVIDAQGQVKSLSAPALLAGVYGSDCFMFDLGGGTTSLTPSWQSSSVSGSSTGYLFTGSQCPANVGIGTATPRSRLDVIGTTYTTKLALGIDPQNMTGHFHMKVPVNSTYALPYDVFRIEAADRQLLNLDHTGLLRTREVMVDAEVWPDYVFTDDYRLMPLAEVEAYIDQHGHLPNVPDAETIETEGQNLGEMNKILLEKVEELTLHLIEQQKEIEELKRTIQK